MNATRSYPIWLASRLKRQVIGCCLPALSANAIRASAWACVCCWVWPLLGSGRRCAQALCADLKAGEPIELQGEYIPIASAYPTDDNSDPVLPVLHFTHHPVGYVMYKGVHYS